MIFISISRWIITHVSFVNRMRSKSFSITSTLFSMNLDLNMKRLIDSRRYDDALVLFNRYCQSKSLTDISLNLALKACAKSGNRQRGIQIHQQLSLRSLQNPFIQSSLIHFYMQCQDTDRAQQIFDGIENKIVVIYGAMCKGYISNGMPEKVLQLFEQMIVKPDPVMITILFNACAKLTNEHAKQFAMKIFRELPKTFFENQNLVNSTMDMLMRFGEVEQAEQLFLKTKIKNTNSYTIMMNGYNLSDQPLDCLKLFEQVQERRKTIDGPMAVALVAACSQIALLSTSRRILQYIPLDLRDNSWVKSTLIDMWGKVGVIEEAKKIFQTTNSSNIFACTAMINAYGRNGMGAEAIDLYREVPQNCRDSITHICVLSACSHSGLVNEARSIFNEIEIKNEKIISAMIDCLCRVFLFDEAQKLIDDYEKTHPPYWIMYTTMLSAARNHNDSLLSKNLYDRMQFLFPDHTSQLISASILVSNTYFAAGNHQQAEQIRIDRIKRFGNKVKPGCSWTEVNGELVEFKAHDRSHHRSSEIYAELDRLAKELKEHGHQFDSSWITRPLKKDETIESVLCGHSEKLAIAFNLIQQPQPSFIQVTQNLRVCGDCHRATKLIAKIRQCEIVVRDANRIHHFHLDGQCSCNDHF